MESALYALYEVIGGEGVGLARMSASATGLPHRQKICESGPGLVLGGLEGVEVVVEFFDSLDDFFDEEVLFGI